MCASDRRRQLLDVASDLLAKKGLLALRLDALASAAGVSRPVVYEHFPGRTALVIALYQDFADLLHARTKEVLASSLPSAEARVRASVRAYFDVVEERGEGIRILLASTGWDPEIEAAHHQIRRQTIRRWTEAVMESTDLPLAEAEAAASAMTASCWALIGQWQRGDIDRERAEEIQFEISLAALERLRTLGPLGGMRGATGP
jgi:AcrR family transcriptional regulator